MATRGSGTAGMLGARFGKGVVLTVAGEVRNRHTRFRLKCDCGNEYEAAGWRLRAGGHLSCGCSRYPAPAPKVFRYGKAALPIPQLTDAQRARFHSSYERLSAGECWLWCGKRDRRGYGQFHASGHNYRANRIAYALANGDPGINKFVCHACDNPPCVNPAHLWAGTQQDNVDDRQRKGRERRGEAHAASKLREHDVRAIRESARSDKDEAAAYQVTPQLVRKIRRRAIWRHVS